MGAVLYSLIVLLNFLLLGILMCYRKYKEEKKIMYPFLITMAVIFLAATIFDTFIGAALSSLINGFLVLFEIISHFVKKGFKKTYSKTVSFSIACVLAFAYFAYSFYVASDLVVTNYSFDGDSEFKIVQISDIHYGKFSNPKKLTEIVSMVNSENADLVALTGDIFDENTDYEELVEACGILKNIKSRYGVFYIVGNHDGCIKTPTDYEHNSEKLDEIFMILKNHGIHVLFDQAVLIGDKYVLVGRKDRSYSDRKTVDEILKSCNFLNNTKEVIVLDHQPTNYEETANSNSNVRLVLSGHTHGGQLFPINILYRFSARHDDDLIYGTTNINGVDFVVSSGATGGQMPIKNCTKSEIVAINLQ